MIRFYLFCIRAHILDKWWEVPMKWATKRTHWTNLCYYWFFIQYYSLQVFFFFFLRKCRYGILVQSNYLSEWVKAVWFIWGFELYKSETISGDFLVQSLRSYQLATTNSLCGWDYSGFSAGPAICVCECMAGYTFANCMFPPWSLTMENFPIPE